VTRVCFGEEDRDAGLYAFDGQPKTVEEAIDRIMQSLFIYELLEMVHRYLGHFMEADLRDIKQSWVPSLAPKPRDITPERTPQTCLLCGEIEHSRGDCPDACEPEMHEHSVGSNQCFLDHFEVSMAEISQASTSCARQSR
jgi:hypothetical protein